MADALRFSAFTTAGTMLLLLVAAQVAQGQALTAYAYTYGNIYCSSGIPQGPFQLDSSCVSLSATTSIGGSSSGSSCSPDGNWVIYNLYNASGSCSGGPVTRMKAGSTSCQGGGSMQWYTPYCDSSASKKILVNN